MTRSLSTASILTVEISNGFQCLSNIRTVSTFIFNLLYGIISTKRFSKTVQNKNDRMTDNDAHMDKDIDKKVDKDIETNIDKDIDKNIDSL